MFPSHYLDNKGLNIPPGIEDPAFADDKPKSKVKTKEKEHLHLTGPDITFKTFRDRERWEERGE